jgi:hypothetical protein
MTTPRIRILPYRRGSEGAAALSAALWVPRVRLPLSESRFRPRDYDIIINWGHSDGMPGPWWSGRIRYLNHPSAVLDARDKLRTLNLLRAAGVPTVEWTTNPEDAATWLSAGITVFVRHSLTGQGGSGIEVVSGLLDDPLPVAPLYTRHFKARHEYRVHVVGDHTFVVKKRRRNGAERNFVRNYANGYVYCTNNVTAPQSVVDAGTTAIKALGLTFGAVDILCTEDGEARVLEVNTAPGLEGRTVEFYRSNIAPLIGKVA